MVCCLVPEKTSPRVFSWKTLLWFLSSSHTHTWRLTRAQQEEVIFQVPSRSCLLTGSGKNILRPPLCYVRSNISTETFCRAGLAQDPLWNSTRRTSDWSWDARTRWLPYPFGCVFKGRQKENTSFFFFFWREGGGVVEKEREVGPVLRRAHLKA